MGVLVGVHTITSVEAGEGCYRLVVEGAGNKDAVLPGPAVWAMAERDGVLLNALNHGLVGMRFVTGLPPDGRPVPDGCMFIQRLLLPVESGKTETLDLSAFGGSDVEA